MTSRGLGANAIFHASAAMSSVNDATKAAYFLYGLEAGMLSEADVKKWAFSVIEARDMPPSEIIEVAMSRSREQLFESLKVVRGDRDIQLAGRWLLGLLKTMLKNDPSNMKAIVRKAMQVAVSTSQPEDVYHRLDGIDDQISLAESNTYGTLEMCRADLEAALAQYDERITI